MHVLYLYFHYLEIFNFMNGDQFLLNQILTYLIINNKIKITLYNASGRGFSVFIFVSLIIIV